MRVLVVQENADLGGVWCRFLSRNGITADLSTTSDAAIERLADRAYTALVIDPALPSPGALPVTDFASYRNPDIAILAVTGSSFFSGGTVMELIPNARGVLRTPLRPDDLLAFVEHYAGRAERATAARAAGSGPARSA